MRTAKKINKLSIIVISGQQRQIRRWEIKRWWLQLCGGALAAIFIIFGVSGLGMLHYRHGYESTEIIRVQNAKFDQEREELKAKIAELEQVVERTDRLATRLENKDNIQNKGTLTKSIGPISEAVTRPIDLKALATRAVGGAEIGPAFAMRGIEGQIGNLRDRAHQVEERLGKVYDVRKSRNAFWASQPTLWPVHGWITSPFGPRRAPTVGATHFHEGIDIAAPVGTPVMASADGVVRFSGYKSGFGKALVIDHGYGISTLYAHNSSLLVLEGQHVTRGMQVSAIGMTGRTTGAHLHYEVMVDGVPVDPRRYLDEK